MNGMVGPQLTQKTKTTMTLLLRLTSLAEASSLVSLALSWLPSRSPTHVCFSSFLIFPLGRLYGWQWTFSFFTSTCTWVGLRERTWTPRMLSWS